MCRKATIIRSRISEVSIINNKESNEYLDKVAEFMAHLEIDLFTSSEKTVIFKKEKVKEVRETTAKRPVVDKKTGVVYTSIRKAALYCDISNAKLGKMLKGKSKNTTSMEFYFNKKIESI